MASIAFAFPSTVAVSPKGSVGMVRPGVSYVEASAGNGYIVDEGRVNLRSYTLAPKLDAYGGTALFDLERFYQQVVTHAGGIAWIPEVFSGNHRGLICGGIADGTKTTFPIPVLNPSDVTIFVNGVPQYSGYTVHSTANLWPYALFSDGEDATWFSSDGKGAISTQAGMGMVGSACIKEVPYSGVAGSIRPNTFGAVTAGRTYTLLTAILSEATGSGQPFKGRFLWYDDSGYLGVSAGDNVYLNATDGWTLLPFTATASAGSTRALVQVQNQDTASVTPFYSDAFAYCPGDYDTWHGAEGPQPGLVEFDTAPAANSRITAAATGKRITRCRISRDNSWTYDSRGNTQIRNITAIEAPEV